MVSSEDNSWRLKPHNTMKVKKKKILLVIIILFIVICKSMVISIY